MRSPVPDVCCGAKDVAEWETVTRSNIKEYFEKNVYGVKPEGVEISYKYEEISSPVDMMDGKAIRKQVAIKYVGPGGEGTINVVAFIPKSEKPVPGFVFICNRNPRNIDATREIKSDFWPAEEIVDRGYAAIAFHYSDVAIDRDVGYTNGVYQVYDPDCKNRKEDSWGAISAWAWGASRVMDWIEQEPLLDSARMGIVGHSRGGKTALWCGASDERFALAISSCSGCSGAKLNRADLPDSESIKIITERFPYWFCENYKQYVGRDEETPFDAHHLLGLIAPRNVYVSSHTEDAWAGQEGEFASCVYASRVWELYGKKGFPYKDFPEPEVALHDGDIGYHLMPGEHNLDKRDWKLYMDFADKHIK